VEPICRKYLELRYRMLPDLYSVVHEGHRTGLPIVRALWLHYADDAAAVGRGDQYLWGRDILVAPVLEQGATSRTVYLPRGRWYDFWASEAASGAVSGAGSGAAGGAANGAGRGVVSSAASGVASGAALEAIEGGREITRPVDLETMPLYVRAGAIIPTGPLKQYTDEPTPADAPLTLTIYPGADGSFLFYEDDGKTYAHRKGAWMGLDLTWTDATKRLTARLTPGSRMLTPRRHLAVRLAGTQATKNAVFDGRELTVIL
jgi:alpha-glucosidase/alpha-D-xyloside xylohydrolase